MGNNQNPPQPSPMGEEAACHCERQDGASQSQDNEMLKHGCQSDILDDTNPLPQSLPRGREVKRSSSLLTLHSSLKKRAAFTLAEGATHVVHSNNIRRVAFTLAEVLITLGIIGVVAAMTIPTIVYKHQKMVSETAVKKFYTNINQAVLMAETQKGEERTAWPVTGTVLYDNYLKDYLKVLSADYNTGGSRPQVMLYFSDGTLALISSRDITFCVNQKSYEKYKDSGYQTGNCMMFGFYPSGGFTNCLQENYYKKGVVPYLNDSFNYCSDIENHDFEAMCQHRLYAKVLEQNGWRYPKECNVKF